MMYVVLHGPWAFYCTQDFKFFISEEQCHSYYLPFNTTTLQRENNQEDEWTANIFINKKYMSNINNEFRHSLQHDTKSLAGSKCLSHDQL